MMDALKALFKQPGWVIALVLGCMLVAFPCVTIDKDYHLSPHAPSTLWPVLCGVALLIFALVALGITLWAKNTNEQGGAGVDLTRVTEKNGVVRTTVSGCEIRVVEGHIQDYAGDKGTVVVLPCNEYFDDRCAGDTKSALGSYVNQVFNGDVSSFISQLQDECRRTLGAGCVQQKTNEDRAVSFGVGRCVLLRKPLGSPVPVAVVSTTTQRASEGLAARISYQFESMRNLVAKLADARLSEVVMPILGAGHGRIDPPLAFVGLLLALAEAARYGQGGQRLRKATVVVFKRDNDTPAEVNRLVVRRALALVGSRD